MQFGNFVNCAHIFIQMTTPIFGRDHFFALNTIYESRRDLLLGLKDAQWAHLYVSYSSTSGMQQRSHLGLAEKSAREGTRLVANQVGCLECITCMI